jgi:uncharacterized glyoxalase superfamily protein PhnB
MKKYSAGKMIPMLNVRNVSNSLDFYKKALGFELVSSVEDLSQFRWGIIGSDTTELMLSESQHAPIKQQPDPFGSGDWSVNFYFYPPDIKGLHQHLLSNSYEPSPLKETDYGVLEFNLQDPDGHILSFGAET